MDIFTNVAEMNLDEMNSDQLGDISAKLSGEMDEVRVAYRSQQKSVHAAIATALKKEKTERDKNPAHKAKEQGVKTGE